MRSGKIMRAMQKERRVAGMGRKSPCSVVRVASVGRGLR
jgi:hypothetical protein